MSFSRSDRMVGVSQNDKDFHKKQESRLSASRLDRASPLCTSSPSTSPPPLFLSNFCARKKNNGGTVDVQLSTFRAPDNEKNPSIFMHIYFYNTLALAALLVTELFILKPTKEVSVLAQLGA